MSLHGFGCRGAEKNNKKDKDRSIRGEGERQSRAVFASEPVQMRFVQKVWRREKS